MTQPSPLEVVPPSVPAHLGRLVRNAVQARLLYAGTSAPPGPPSRPPAGISGDARFLTAESAEAATPRINVVLNWCDELQKLAPTGR